MGETALPENVPVDAHGHMDPTTSQQPAQQTITLPDPHPAYPASQSAGPVVTALPEPTPQVTPGTTVSTTSPWNQTAPPTIPETTPLSAQLISQSATQMVTALPLNALMDAHGAQTSTTSQLLLTVPQTMFNNNEDSRFTTPANGEPSVMTPSTWMMPMLHA